jgi:tetratricopeptide (TPR) repeat protein
LIELLKFQPKEALPYLEQAYGIDKSNLKYAEEYSSLLIDQNDLDTAGPVLRSALMKAAPQAVTNPATAGSLPRLRVSGRGYNPDQARLQHLLGLLYNRIPEKWDAAESAYNEALQIYRTLAAADASHLPSVAGDLINLGNLQRHRMEWSEAEKSYKEALRIYRTLSAQDQGAYAPYAAKVAVGLGNLYSDPQQQNRPEDNLDNAEELYTAALEIFTQLATKNPSLYLPDKAQVLNNLGSLYENNPQWRKYSAVERWSKSLDSLKQALEIRTKLAESNPEAYKPGVAQTLSSRAGLYRQQRNWPLAEQGYKDAIQIRRELAKTNPDEVNPLLAGSLEGLASVYRSTNHHKESADSLEEASGIYRKLAATNPGEYQLSYAGTLNNLAIEHSAINDNAKAVTEIEDAVNIFRQLAKSNPTAYGDRLARSLMVDANIQRGAGKDPTTVCSIFKEAETATQDPSLAATIVVQAQCK